MTVLQAGPNELDTGELLWVLSSLRRERHGHGNFWKWKWRSSWPALQSLPADDLGVPKELPV